MNQLIIYKQDSGVVAIIRPAAAAVDAMGILGVAKKNVPLGRPFKLIDESELPADKGVRNAWTVDDADLTDGVGGDA